MAVAGRRDYSDILDGSVTVPPDADVLDTTKDKDKLLARKANQNAYQDLVLANKDPVAFNIIDKSITKDHPKGNARLAWLSLDRKYDSSGAATVVKLSGMFHDSKLNNTIVDPEEWIVFLEILRARLDQKSYEITEKNFMNHVMNHLPSQYDNTVEDLEDKMDNLAQPLDMETMKEKLHSRWLKIRARSGKAIGYELGDDDEEQAALFASHNGDFSGQSALLARQFKGHCTNCGKIGHKAENCPQNKSSGGDSKIAFGDYGSKWKGKMQ